MAFTCDQCGKRRGGNSITTITGRSVCRACDDHTTGLAAGVMGGEAMGADPVGSAISTVGWRERIRRAVAGKQQR